MAELEQSEAARPTRRRLASRVGSLVSRRRLTGPSATLLGTTVVMNVLRIGNTMILTRFLSPSDYGLIGIVTSIFFVIVMLTDTGAQLFVVRHERGLEPEFLDTVWTVHLLRGIGNALVMMAIAIPLALFLGKAALAPLLVVAAISLAIDGAASLSLLTAVRLKMVRKLSLVDFAAFVTQLVVGLIAAWYLRNVWSIIIAIMVQSLTRTLASYVIFPHARRRFRFDRAVAGELWRFSRTIAASSTLTLIMSQVDRLVLARLFTLPQFGVYSIAGSLAVAPTLVAGLYSTRIMYPSLAEAHRTAPERLRQTYHALRGLVFYGYLLSAGGLIGSAPLLVRILYDPRYEGAAFYLRLLAVTTAMIMLTRPMNDLLVAAGNVRATLDTNVVRIGWLLAAAVAGYLAIGPIGVVLALASIELPAYLFLALRLSQRGIYSVWQDLRAFATIGAGVAIGAAGSAVILAILPVR